MIAEANRLPYGLAAYSWTNDAARQKRLAREVESGHVLHQHHRPGRPGLPRSAASSGPGHGSENGPEGVMACMVLKAVHEG